jgi:hypothetical protein
MAYIKIILAWLFLSWWFIPVLCFGLFILWITGQKDVFDDTLEVLEDWFFTLHY